MDKGIRVLVIAACTVVVCCGMMWFYRQVQMQQAEKTILNQPIPTLQPTPVQKPVFEWNLIKTETTAVQPGGGMTGYELPEHYSSMQRKIVIKAKLPVMVAYFPETSRELVSTNLDAALRTPIWHCVNQHVLNTTLQCALNFNESYLLLVRDERTAGQQLSAGLLGGLGIKKPLEDAVTRNDVTVEVWQWMCTRNCQQ